jgi:hypothetical protein
MSKKYELKLIITIDEKNPESVENIEDLKNTILSGKIQREWVADGNFKKCVGTFKELENEK